MAIFRQVHTKVWKDGWFIDLSLPEKLLFLYLVTNEQSSISGIYELPMRVIQFETGLDTNQIESALIRFTSADKVLYDDGVIWVRNLRKYHETKSVKLQTRIQKDIDLVPCGSVKSAYLIRYPENNIGYPEVEIPLNSYTSSYSSDLNAPQQKNTAYQHPDSEPIANLKTAISQIANYPLTVGENEEEYDKLAHTLEGWDATPEQVRGFAAWWERNSYYDDGGLPTLNTIRKSWRNYVKGVERKPTDTSNGAESAWQQVKQLAAAGKLASLPDGPARSAVKRVGSRNIKQMTEFTEGKVRQSFMEVYGAG